MSFLAADAINLIRDTLAFIQEDSNDVFASPEVADFFRMLNAKCQMLNMSGAKPPAPQKEILNPEFGILKEEIKANSPKEILNAKINAHPPLLLTKEIELPILEKQELEKPNSEFKNSEFLPAVVEKQGLEKPNSEFKIQNSEFSEVRKTFAQLFPGFPILDAIPNDAIAIKIAERWKTKNKTAPISILSLHEPQEQRALLEQVAKALDVTFGSARVIHAEPIEKEKQWEAFLSVPDLKIVLACDYTLWQLNGLMKFYKENPTVGSRTLGSVSLFLLPDLSLYLKDPLLKRSLWKALCQKLSS